MYWPWWMSLFFWVAYAQLITGDHSFQEVRVSICKCMSSGISRQNCCCTLSKNFSNTLCKAKYSLKMECTEWTNAYLHQIQTIFPHNQSQHLAMITSFWFVEGYWCAAIFKIFVCLLNLCDTHGIIAKGLLNFPNDFYLIITNLMQ